ncbi:AhpC/TSA antioxidant enzyme-domain-containing protein, partial [Trametes elegans]
ARRHQQRKEDQPLAATFDEHAGLARDQIARAAPLTVIAQNGLRVQFGELFRERKTIVCFIRHFWCVLPTDYMYSIARTVDYEGLKRAGIDFVIIGCGSSGMIKSYRQIFRTPIPMYTDPTLRLYAALGMTRRTNDPGLDSEKGDYVRHGPIGGLAMVVRNALRVGMPVWEKGGDTSQLGGEFVFGPGLKCSFAHRMTNTRSHASISEVLMSAGYHFAIPTAADGTPALTPEEEEAWMEERRRAFARMRAKREKRREFGPGAPAHMDAAHLYEPELEYGHGSDTDSASVSPHGSWASSSEKREMSALVSQRERELERARESALERKRKTGTTRAIEGVVKQRRGSKGLGLHVSNPDDHHDHHDQRDRDHDRDLEHGTARDHHRKHQGPTRVHVAHHELAPGDWDAVTPTLAYINELGRREDGYDTVEEGTPAYSYRQA